jgi:hypothetical protein
MPLHITINLTDPTEAQLAAVRRGIDSITQGDPDATASVQSAPTHAPDSSSYERGWKAGVNESARLLHQFLGELVEAYELDSDDARRKIDEKLGELLDRR